MALQIRIAGKTLVLVFLALKDAEGCLMETIQWGSLPEKPRLQDLQLFAEKLLESVIITNYSILDVVDAVSHLRQRPIQLCPWSMPDLTVYGAWITTPERDYVFFEKNTSRLHQEHIVAHELSHILLGHKTILITPTQLPSLTPAMRHLAPGQRNSDEEYDAETLAISLQVALIRKVGWDRLTAYVATAPLWDNLVFGLGMAY